MAQPNPSDRHIDAALTNISIAYMQDDMPVAMQAFLPVPVKKQTDKFFEYDRAFWSRIVADKRAPGAESAGGGYKLNQLPYDAEKFSVHIDTPFESSENEDSPPLDSQMDDTNWVTEQMKLRDEKDWASTAFTTSVWTGSTSGGDITPGTLWSASGSTPIQDIRAQRNSIKQKTGRRPNVFVVGADVMAVLEDHPDFLDRVQQTQLGVLTTDLLAAILGLEVVLEADLTETTSAEGVTPEVNAFIVDPKDALLLYRPARPGLRTPAAGYTFRWTGKTGTVAGRRIKRWFSDDRDSWRTEMDEYVDFKIVAPDLGVFFNNPVA